MRVVLVTLIGLLALGGCAEQRRAEADAAMARQIASCRVQYPGNGHYLDRARCDEQARREKLAARELPSDLTEVYLATRAEIAGRLDRGEINLEQGNLAIKQAESELNERLLSRRRAQAEVLSRMFPQPASNLIIPYQMRPAPPSSYNTNCTRTGNMVNCTTY